MRHPSTQPTNVELRILRALWDNGPSTVRQVQTALGQERELQYTTVLKMLLTMHEKGQVQRDETDRSHVYHAVKDRASTQRGLLRDLLDRAFGGSARELVAMALDEGPLAQEEQAEIQELLANARKHKKV